ncbi:pentapeptide repeat-containing protein [Plectonema cf. radiosum LEGE 06105]|uniref:Pentapeptide repeat-containing protein n=1 Tax=Plectonema cf. radiosum LEGE 06105 TaxID=945769 RepID=A0A8J7FIU1_9CYAN|nr:pentapeptide repeat-containing protein [Plectonema radiosum]MBE9217118.1 pentapeptide repeat-containing protein [Plectonema cf. radiosum LEGE 06105]
MNLSIRHWLTENYIEISQIKEFSQPQITGVALRMIRDMEVRNPLPFDICTLAEVLELPLGVVWDEISVFARLTQSILGVLAQNKPFKRNEATWLAFQVAYLQALEEVLIEEESLSRIWLERTLLPKNKVTRLQEENLFTNGSVKALRDEHLQAFIKIFRGEKLNDVQAEEALHKVTHSSFVQQINHIAVAWLVANTVPKVEAELIIRRLEHKLLGHLIVVVSENSTSLVQLQKFFKIGNSLELRTTEIHWSSEDKIDCNKQKYRANLIKKLGEPLLIESFALKDVYVPPKGIPLKGNYQPVDLMKWVVSQLEDLETITIIESDSGYGKTSFCQIFAARVARKFYPDWMPILINLSDIEERETFLETLESALRNNYRIDLSDWLKVTHHKYLLILDGLNELSPSTTVSAIFIQQLFKFQGEKRHKIILTSQSWVLQDIASKAASKLQRIKIQPWGQDEWKQWFANLSKVQSMTVAQNLFTLLKTNKAFSQNSHFLLAEFVRHPLTLYLLAVLHSNKLLDDEILQLATNPQITNSATVLWRIYEGIDQWLFGYSSGMVSRYIHPQELPDEIQSVALKILLSGKKKINLTGNFNKLSAFYFKPLSNVQFSHSQLGEYLCAKAIISQLKILIKRDRNNYAEINFTIDSPQTVAEHLYNLLGYGILTPEIEELVIEGLRREKKHKFSFELLCNRLQSFWYAYCRGRWLDQGIAHQAWSYFKQLQNPVNVEQVNAAVGINVFLLLSACYRETKQTFSPCGNPTLLTEFQPEALMKLIAKTAVFHPDMTRVRIGEKSLTFLNLSKADLTQAILAQVNFTNTDLSNAQLKNACLVGANLADANLTGANLTGANLANANLTNATLTGANLTGANLLGVNLDLVNLSNACLFQAIIAEAHKETALANGAVFSLDKFEELQRLLSYQSQPYDTNTGEQTEIAFNQIPSIGQIESVEGEPSSPLELDDDIEDETVLGTTDF